MDSLIVYLEAILVLVNQILASFTVILTFSVLAFIIAYNRKSPVGRSFAVLLGCMCVTYIGDAALFQVDSLSRAAPWLKFQWLGIAFAPAAYLHFSDALLRTTNAFSKVLRGAVMAAYALSGLFLYLAVATTMLVRDGFFHPGITQLQSGPLAWLFTVYFFAAMAWGILNTRQARARCLTSATRHRMTALTISFIPPAFGVFPYLVIASQVQVIPVVILLAILFTVNVGIIFTLLYMGYNVSFFDAFSPDRVVKYRLVTFLLRGPLVAALVIMVIIALPDRSIILSLPRDVILVALMVGIIVLAPLASNSLKPIVSRLLYRSETDEVELLRTIDARLLTTTDLEQALENVLTTICELLRVRTGFIANVAARKGPRLETAVGSETLVEAGLSQFEATILQTIEGGIPRPLFVAAGDFWYAPLQTEARDKYLGLLGVEARTPTPDLSENEAHTIEILLRKAEFVLEDRRLQQNVFRALRGIVPEMERAQRIRSAVRYQDSPIDHLLSEASPLSEPDFPKMVHDALTHYWGGPKLTASPLLRLKVVQEAIEAHGGNTIKGLRSVLGEAIENIRPTGERRMTTSEWLFYNILELKFIRGLKVRDVARRLSMSEADLYRKQKIAIREVARSLSEMEARESRPAEAPLHQPLESDKIVSK